MRMHPDDFAGIVEQHEAIREDMREWWEEVACDLKARVYTAQDIADALGMSRANVYRRIREARA